MSLSWNVVLPKTSAWRFFMTKALRRHEMLPLVSWMWISPREAILVLSLARRASWLLGRMGIWSWETREWRMKETVALVSRVMLIGWV